MIPPDSHASVGATAPARDAAEQAALHAALRELFERKITFNQVLGVRVASFDPERPALSFAMRPDLVGHFAYGRLHGGVISTVLDATGAFALMVAQGAKHRSESAEQIMHRFLRMGTIDLRVDYLRPGIGERFVATAEVSRLGGRLGATQMRLTSDRGEVIATAAAAYTIS